MKKNKISIAEIKKYLKKKGLEITSIAKKRTNNSRDNLDSLSRTVLCDCC